MSQLKTNSITNIGNTGDDNITLNSDGSIEVAGDIQSTSQNGGQLAGFRNLLINGSMTFWQRGTGGSGTGYQGPDRWRSASDSPVVTRRTIAAGTGQAGVPATYTCEISTSGSSAGITQCIELPYGGGRQDGFNVGNQYTLSWYADTTNPAEFDLYTPSFVDDSTGLNSVTAGTKGAIELIETMGSTGWGRFQSLITITGNVAPSNLALLVGVATLGNTHQVTSIQLEPGPVATPFELRPIGTELALCQRYYQTLGDAYMSTIKASGDLGFTSARTVTMRTTPTETGDLNKVINGAFTGTDLKWNLSATGFNGGNTANALGLTADAEL
jgi:hypothetical protein